MKQFIEFIPLIVFFAVYKFYDIYTATGGCQGRAWGRRFSQAVASNSWLATAWPSRR